MHAALAAGLHFTRVSYNYNQSPGGSRPVAARTGSPPLVPSCPRSMRVVTIMKPNCQFPRHFGCIIHVTVLHTMRTLTHSLR